ncbi:MAG: lysine biosynthesis protein LysX [Thaumarchaeota archaeon]|nr:lysine biosynthesis protein LysX [Nitrososphaerota archaeon]
MSNKLTILFDKIRWEEKALYESARKKSIDVTNVNCNNLFIDLNNGITEDYGVVLQRCVSYFRSLHSTAALEGKGVNVVNPLHTSIVAGNKLFSHMKLKEANITTPKSIVAFSKDSALAALDKLEYPSVLKPTVGSWGRLIALLNDREAAESVIEDREYMFPLYQIYYLEEFVKRPPRDIRSIVVGDNVVGAIYRYSPEGRWKTNMSLGGKAELCPLTKDLEDICLRAARAVSGEVVGVDLMEDDRKGLLVHEVNNTTEFKNVTRVTGNDIPSIIIDYTMSSKR